MALAAALVAAALPVAGCGDEDPAPSGGESQQGQSQQGDGQPRSGGGQPAVRSVATGLEAPWEIAFLPDGRALITERPGRVRLLPRDGRLRARPLAEIDVAAIGEGGLLGLAVDPDFDRNQFVYLYRTTEGANQLLRYRLAGDRLEQQAVLVDGIQAAPIHDGGRVRFGPDGRLYFTTGDAAQESLSQDRSSLNGKVLRMEPSQFRGAGGRPEVFTLGHRNPQGLAWQPDSGRLMAPEHGPDGDDEVNVLREGRNYGWPEARGEDHGGFEAPVAVYEDSIAPSGATFVARRGSAWTGDLLVGALVGEQIRRLSFDGARVTRDEALFEDRFGRIRTVVEGPDGALYALTSNRDGRGSPREGDDRVLRIEPPSG